MCFLRQCCTHSLCPSLWSQCSKTGSVLAMQPLCRSHGWTVVNHYYTQNWGLTMCFLRQCCTHSLCPTLWSQCSKTGSVLAMQPLCRSHGWTVVNHYYTQNWGLNHVFFAAMLHSLFVPHIVATVPQNWLGLGHAAFVQKSWWWTVVNHYYTQNWGLTMCFLRQCCTHSLCPTLWSLCPKTGSVLAMQFLCSSHGWTVVNHYYTQNWGLNHVFFAAMLHSLFVPHIVVTMPQNWLGLGHAVFVQKSWLDCGKSLLHTNWGLTMCFLRQCCTHSLCPTLWPLCPKTGSVLAMQPLCRSHGWTVVNHYYTQRLGSHHVFFAAMLHSQFVPHIVATVPQNWLGLGHAAFVQKSWLDCGKSLLHTNWGLTMCFLRQCCTHSLCPTLWPLCPKTGSVLAMQFLCSSHGWTVVNHYYTQNWGLTMCFLRQCCTHSLCPTVWSQCAPKLARSWAMQPSCSSHGWTVVNHYCKTGVSPCVFCGNAALTVCAPHCGHCAPKLARSWPCSLCAEVGWLW